MPSMSACLLGSINLSEYVINPFTKEVYFDYDSLIEDIIIYVRALNECLEENTPFMPLREQEEAARKYRAIGLGYFGVGDMFIKMGKRYGSEESIEIADKISSEVATAALLASAELGEEFPIPKIIIDNMIKFWGSDFYKEHIDKDIRILPVNTSLLTCAPTGSLSTMLGVSGGIEPIFSLKMWRKTESLNGGKETYYEIDVPVIDEWKRINKIKETPDWILKSTALEQNISERIHMQAAWQKHIDNAISSTVNLPEKTTVEQVEQLYTDAWKNGLKGITIYRSGCKRGAILTAKKEDLETLSKEEKEDIVEEIKMKWGEIIPCSDNLIGLKRKIMTGCGSLHITAHFDWDGNFREIFLNKGSDGGCNAFMVGLSRSMSQEARAGIPLDKIVQQQFSVPACPSYVSRTATKHDTSRGKNCPSAIGYALLEMQKEIDSIFKKDEFKSTIVGHQPKGMKEELVEAREFAETTQYGKTEQQCIDEGICPLCYKRGEVVDLKASGGCYTCDKCGFTKCD